MKKKFILALSGLLVVGIGYLIISNSYPVALIDSQPISARDFKKDYSGGYQYYQRMLDLYAEDAAVLNAEETKREIQRAILDKLIEDKLIEAELGRMLKADEINALVEQKISEIVKNQEVSKGAEILYGFSENDFKERVLIPQARMEILESRLLLENKKLDDWLKEAKSKAKVIILIPGFFWDGEEILIK